MRSLSVLCLALLIGSPLWAAGPSAVQSGGAPTDSTFLTSGSEPTLPNSTQHPMIFLSDATEAAFDTALSNACFTDAQNETSCGTIVIDPSISLIEFTSTKVIGDNDSANSSGRWVGLRIQCLGAVKGANRETGSGFAWNGSAGEPLFRVESAEQLRIDGCTFYADDTGHDGLNLANHAVLFEPDDGSPSFAFTLNNTITNFYSSSFTGEDFKLSGQPIHACSEDGTTLCDPSDSPSPCSGTCDPKSCTQDSDCTAVTSGTFCQVSTIGSGDGLCHENEQSEGSSFEQGKCEGSLGCVGIYNQQTQNTRIESVHSEGHTGTAFMCNRGHMVMSNVAAVSNEAGSAFGEIHNACKTFIAEGYSDEFDATLDGSTRIKTVGTDTAGKIIRLEGGAHRAEPGGGSINVTALDLQHAGQLYADLWLQDAGSGSVTYTVNIDNTSGSGTGLYVSEATFKTNEQGSITETIDLDNSTSADGDTIVTYVRYDPANDRHFTGKPVAIADQGSGENAKTLIGNTVDPATPSANEISYALDETRRTIEVVNDQGEQFDFAFLLVTSGVDPDDCDSQTSNSEDVLCINADDGELFHCETGDGVCDESPAGEWQSIGGGGATVLSDLTDAQVTTPADGHILLYDGVTDNRFENQAMSGDATITAGGVIEVTQADALEANGSNCSAGQWAAGVDASGVAEGCTADDDVPDAGDFAAASDLDLNGAITATTADCESYTILNPGDGDDHLLAGVWKKFGVTITDIDCIVEGSSTPTISLTIQECSSTGASCTDTEAAITCDADGAADNGTIDDATVDAGDWMKALYGGPGGTVTSLNYTVCFSRNVVQ